jgi:ribosomal protein S18 acetylase RimI-like enzyme
MAAGRFGESDISIHQADRSDQRQMQAVVELLDHYARDPMGIGRPLDSGIRQRLLGDLPTRADCVIHLAWCADQAVGLAVCFEGYSTFAARPLMNVHDLVVRQSFRGQGIGRKLLQAVQDQAKARGCCKVTLEVRQDNPSAMQLYQELGFGSDQAEYVFWSKSL